jgi:hypothetical protein
MPNSRRAALRFQAAYYVLSGLWPLVSRRSFEAVTGPKADWWLVQMVALLAATIGTTIGLGVREERPSPAIRTLAVLSALSFTGIDVVHSLRGRISKVYLGDAVVELALLALLLRN